MCSRPRGALPKPLLCFSALSPAPPPVAVGGGFPARVPEQAFVCTQDQMSPDDRCKAYPARSPAVRLGCLDAARERREELTKPP